MGQVIASSTYMQRTSLPFRHSHDPQYQEGISRMKVDRLGLW